MSRALTTLEKLSGDFRNDETWSPAIVDGPRVPRCGVFDADGTVLRLQVRTVLIEKTTWRASFAGESNWHSKNLQSRSVIRIKW